MFCENMEEKIYMAGFVFFLGHSFVNKMNILVA